MKLRLIISSRKDRSDRLNELELRISTHEEATAEVINVMRQLMVQKRQIGFSNNFIKDKD